MRHTAIAALIMSLTAAAAATAARADVYRSVDAQGHVQYSDTPTPGAELVHVQRGGDTGTSSLNSAPASNAAAAARNQPPAPASSTISPQADIDKQNAQKAVQQDVEQTRADQCKKATDDYQASLAARRIYRTGPNGERDYLTDDEAEQQRVSLRQAMQSACGS
ncbi:MAG: DUF4124 domain-containing protein [Steroidobacteraceae bacterium]